MTVDEITQAITTLEARLLQLEIERSGLKKERQTLYNQRSAEQGRLARAARAAAEQAERVERRRAKIAEEYRLEAEGKA